MATMAATHNERHNHCGAPAAAMWTAPTATATTTTTTAVTTTTLQPPRELWHGLGPFAPTTTQQRVPVTTADNFRGRRWATTTTTVQHAKTSQTTTKNN